MIAPIRYSGIIILCRLHKQPTFLLHDFNSIMAFVTIRR